MPDRTRGRQRSPYGAFKPWIAMLMVVFGIAGLGVFAWFGVLQ